MWREPVARVSFYLSLVNLPAYPSIIGALFLVILTSALIRRLRIALWIFLGFYQIPAIVFMLVLGAFFILDPTNEIASLARQDMPWIVVSSVIALVLTALGIWARSAFPARLQAGSWWRALVVLVIGIAASAAITFLVFELVDESRRYPAQAIRWSISAAIGIAPDEAPFITHVHGPAWLQFAAGAMSAAVLLFAIATFMHSTPRSAQQDIDDELLVRQLLLTTPQPDSLSYFATRDDRSVATDPTRRSAVSYRVIQGVCLAAGDPLGPPEYWPATIDSWLHEAKNFGWVPAVISASEAGAKAYQNAGMSAIIMGDEAIIKVADFSLNNPAMRDVRRSIAGPTNAGYTVKVRRQGEIPPAELTELSSRVNDWRQGGDERGLSMASSRFADERDSRVVVVTAHDSDGKPQGLLSFVPWGRKGLSLDVMRRSPPPTRYLA